MLVIDNGDAVRGKASVADVVTYVVSGYVGTVATLLGKGKLGGSEADMVLSAADATVVTSIILVNIHSSAVTVNSYLKSTTAYEIIPKDLSLGVNWSLCFDGQRISILNAAGELLCSWPVDDTPVDGETDHPISSNWAYDHVAAADPHTGYVLESLFGAQSIIAAVSDNTPVLLTVAASRIVGRKASGNIAAMTGAEALALMTTAVAAELNLLDLAGLTAGEVLVATSATAAAWQKTGVKLSAPDISGIVTAASALTLPAHSSGDISLGTSKLKTTNLLLREIDSTTLGIRDAADSGPRSFAVWKLHLTGSLSEVTTATSVNYAVLFKAYDNVSAMVEVARIQSAVTPTFNLLAGKLTGALTLNAQAFDAGASHLRVNTTGVAEGLMICSTQSGTAGVALTGWHISASPAASDVVLVIRGYGKDLDTPQNNVLYGDMRIMIEDATADHADGKFALYLLRDQVETLALTVSSLGGLGVDADIGTADDPVALFDKFDDALALRKGIQQRNHDLLVSMGVFSKKDSGSGYMMNIQPMTRLLAGGIYQNRALIDTVEYRISQLETELAALKAGLN